MKIYIFPVENIMISNIVKNAEIKIVVIYVKMDMPLYQMRKIKISVKIQVN